MGENAQKIGKKLEIMGCNILELFKWKEKMKDKEIKCRRQGHRNVDGKKKITHGVDLYLEYDDPYMDKKQGVFVECKNRQWKNIDKTKIEQWIQEQINLIECAANDASLMEFYSGDSVRDCALILINTNDGNFKKDKFYEYLSNVQVASKRIPLKIFIAGNDVIDKWNSINTINQRDFQGSLAVIYPSMGNSRSQISNTWSISHLFSKYIFCEAKKLVEEVDGGDKITREKRILVVFCCDIITADSINYLWSMCRFYQYETSYKEFVFYFYPHSSYDVDYIQENFMNILRAYKTKIEPQILNNISYKFIRNSDLPVVNNM